MSISRREALLTGGALFAFSGCVGRSNDSPGLADSHVEVFEPELADFIDPNARFEELGAGYTWAEGPTWDRAREALYFTDVPANKAYRWTASDGVDVFLDPSGAPVVEPGFREAGANGLWYAGDDKVIICNHGTRSLQQLNIGTGKRTTLIDQFDGKAFNSPNDLVLGSNGSIFFTDPPYGLEGLDRSPLKQQAANGVYLLRPDGEVRQLLSDMTFPNGIALSPDETRLYISQSDPDAAYIREITFGGDSKILADRVLFDAKPYQKDGALGLPDGLAVSSRGAIFATGPGGVFVLAPDGKPLGRINTGRATANCAFGEDGSVLFMTAHDRLLKIETRSRGPQWA